MTPEEVLKTEDSPKFHKLMQSAMVVSFNKYGAIKDAFPDLVDAISTLKLKLREYEETGNTEKLVDAANYAMIEFMRPRHEKAHFKGTEGGRGRYWDRGSPNHRRNDGEQNRYWV